MPPHRCKGFSLSVSVRAPSRLTALALAISTAFVHAQTSADENPSLPRLAEPRQGPAPFAIVPGNDRIGLTGGGQNHRFSLQAETSRQLDASVGLRGATILGDGLAIGGGAQLGKYSHELFLNLGWQPAVGQHLVLTAGQLHQKLEFDFPSGRDRAGMTQNSAGLAWRFALGKGWVEHAEFSAYTARTASTDLADKTWSIDTATLFELWNDPRRVAGGQLDGFSGKLGMRPWDGARLEAGLGFERLRYKLLAGDETHRRPTASLGLEQALTADTRLKANADAGAAQTRYGLGLDWRIGGGMLGVQYSDIRGRDRAPNDSRVTLSWTLPLGGRASLAPAFLPASASVPGAASAAPATRSPVSSSLLDQVATRPGWMPMQVIAKRDTTAMPTRLVVVDKTALPAGASIDPVTGNVTAPLGVAVTGIAGVTLNAAPFANTGQFAVSGSSLTINTTLIAQPAVGATDVYVVTLNNAGGGTTNVTINVQRGSVKIVSIVVVAGGADTTPDAFTFTDATGQALGTVVESNAITVAGINAAANISVTGGEYQIDGGAWTSSVGTVTLGQTVKVRHTTSASNSTATNTVLTIGGVSDTFTTTTVAVGADTTPDAFDIPNLTNQALSTVVTTSAITVAGINTSVTASTTVGTIVKNGADTGSNSTTVVAGDTVAVRVTTSGSNSTALNGTLTIGTVPDNFSVTTLAAGGVAPTASAVSISGTTQVGQTLTGSYTYADADSDAEGTSTFRWLRNGVAIAGATASTYTLVNADFGAAITFEVTPVATVAPTTGTPVVSAATAAITLPAGYVSQGGLIWMPNNIMPPSGWATWPNADAYCTGTTILGQTGWRLPTTAELSSLYSSGAIAGQGWALDGTWSSTPHGAGSHEHVFLNDGYVSWDYDAIGYYVSCVR